jgi:hypothetical protein
MNPQEQEEMDFRPQPELNNAFSLSQMQYIKEDDEQKILELRKAGKWCWVDEFPIHCRYTDAVIAIEQHLIFCHDTQKEAEDNPQEHCNLLPPIEKFVPAPSTNEEIPF